MNRVLSRIASLAIVVGPSVSGAADAQPARVDVFASGTEGFHSFRIPAIETAPDGTILAFAEARKHNLADPGEKGQDIDLVLRRSADLGATWSPMQVIEDPGELWSAANPATLVDRDTKLVWLFYWRSKPGRATDTARPGTDDVQTMARTSSDGGRTWSEPVDLTAVARDLGDPKWRVSVTGPGGAIQTSKGRLVVPIWTYEPYRAFAIVSDDHGKTWKRGGLVPGDTSTDECQVAELADGRLLLDLRQSSGPHRWLAESPDGGSTWSALRPGIAVTPVACAIERVASKAGAGDPDLLVWTGPAGPDRRRLVARVSLDGGKTFGGERLISDAFAAYSDLARLPDGSLGVLWEHGVEQGYQRIAFARLDRAFLDPSSAGPSEE